VTGDGSLRRAESARRIWEWISARFGDWSGLLVLFALGLGVRLLLAWYSDGLTFDVSLFRAWSDRLVARSPADFYAADYFADYPPGYLYVLLALGHLSRLVLGAPPSVAVLKLPAIFADLGVALLASLVAVRIAPRGSAGRRVATIAAAAILFNPGLILVSAVWGQVDSVLALLVLGSLWLLGTDRVSIARQVSGIVVLAVAVATKPQAILAVPAVALVLAWPHVSSGRPWWRVGGALTLHALGLALLAYGVAVVMFMPFGIGPGEIAGFYRASGSVYPFTSLWAFNLWGAAGFYLPDVGPEALSIGGVSAYHVGVVAFLLATLTLTGCGWWSLARGAHPGAVAAFGVAAVTCIAFAVLTRMHERYLYLAVAVLTPLVVFRQFRWALAALSLCFLLNIHFVYVYFARHASPPGEAWTIEPLYDLLFGATRDAWQLGLLGLVTGLVCLVVAVLGWRWVEHPAGTGVRDPVSVR
jgi:dolichyl-phosphate-mannose-protein mannosyltransferase